MLISTIRIISTSDSGNNRSVTPTVILGYSAPLTLTLPGPSAGMSGSLDSYCSLKPLCSGMGEVVPARTSPTLLPPSPRTVLSLSCFKVSQCINCRDWHFKREVPVNSSAVVLSVVGNLYREQVRNQCCKYFLLNHIYSQNY